MYKCTVLKTGFQVLQLALWMRGTLTGPLQLVMDDLEVVTMDPETPDTVTNMTVTSDDDWLKRIMFIVCSDFWASL